MKEMEYKEQKADGVKIRHDQGVESRLNSPRFRRIVSKKDDERW